MHMLSEDIKAGEGNLKIRQSDPSKFEVGRNLAITPGKVIFQNELMQLIQYAATTKDVLKAPLLIVPPWINKFYILDLTPEKSFIKWCVDQGITVFVISWVNPDARLADQKLRGLHARGHARRARRDRDSDRRETRSTPSAIASAARCSRSRSPISPPRSRSRVVSATLFAAQVDFTHAGDLMVFVDEERIAQLEEHMKERGYLEGSRMADAFNMLRSNDLIWPYVVNNYLRGKKPFPFDLLYWNSDATRMPAANHSFYLRNCYLDNTLDQGQDEDRRRQRSICSKVKVPIYNLATREDHIAPAKSVLYRLAIFRRPGEVRAGRLRPHRRRRQPAGQAEVPVLDRRQAGRQRSSTSGSRRPPSTPAHGGRTGSQWLKAQDDETVPARELGGGKLKADRGRARRSAMT